jgi:hypothetical protein
MKTCFVLILGLFVTCAAAQNYNLDSYIDLMRESEEKEENTTLDDFTRDQLENRVRELERSLRDYQLNSETPGWNGAGGGEYITDRNNPWFMGTEAVKWCVNHGGEKNFSLSIDDAVFDIHKAFNILTKQVAPIYQERSYPYMMEISDRRLRQVSLREDLVCGASMIFPLSPENNSFDEYCLNTQRHVDEFKLSKRISINHRYVENCADADLEFILGNTEDEKVKKLRSSIGEDKFLKIAGLAFRTEYSTETLRGKGFIYIAADKGPNAYKGEKGNRFKGNNIWNQVNELPQDTPVVYGSELFKDRYMGPFIPVVTHELGHTMGFQHNHKKNLMDEDFPAEVISKGVIKKDDFFHKSQIIGNSLHDIGISPVKIGYHAYLEWDPRNASYIRGESPAIFNFLFKEEPRDGLGAPMHSDFLIFNFEMQKRIDVINDKPFKEDTVTFSNKVKGKLVNVTSHKIESYACGRADSFSPVSFRYLEPVINNDQRTFDAISRQWVNTNATKTTLVNKTVKLFNNRNYKLCGKIFLDDEEKDFLNFEYTSLYYGGADLMLIDPTNSFSYTFNFVENAIRE